MNRIPLILLVLGLLLSACGPKAAPTMSMVDIQNTAIVMAFTMAAETIQAIPTATPIPPTETPTETPLPTATLPLMLITPSPTMVRVASTSTTSSSGCQPLVNWEGKTAKLQLKTDTKQQVKLSLTAYAPSGDCLGYLYYTFKSPMTVSVPLGNYSAFAWIEGKKPFQASGGFTITPGSWDLIVKNDTRIILQGGCSPNC